MAGEGVNESHTSPFSSSYSPASWLGTSCLSISTQPTSTYFHERRKLGHVTLRVPFTSSDLLTCPERRTFSTVKLKLVNSPKYIGPTISQFRFSFWIYLTLRFPHVLPPSLIFPTSPFYSSKTDQTTNQPTNKIQSTNPARDKGHPS